MTAVQTVQLPENWFELAIDRCCDSRHCTPPVTATSHKCI